MVKNQLDLVLVKSQPSHQDQVLVKSQPSQLDLVLVKSQQRRDSSKLLVVFQFSQLANQLLSEEIQLLQVLEPHSIPPPPLLVHVTQPQPNRLNWMVSTSYLTQSSRNWINSVPRLPESLMPKPRPIR
jgi:hypothetical protein